MSLAAPISRCHGGESIRAWSTVAHGDVRGKEQHCLSRWLEPIRHCRAAAGRHQLVQASLEGGPANVLAAQPEADFGKHALSALRRKNKLREETSVGQAALKVMQAQREVLALYYRPPSGLSESGRGEIDLLNH